MYELNAETLLISFMLTWGIGLLPPVLIRFVFLKRPIGKWPAAGICMFFWFVNLILFSILGSQSKTHAALTLVAMVSFWILRKERKQIGSAQNQPSRENV